MKKLLCAVFIFCFCFGGVRVIPFGVVSSGEAPAFPCGSPTTDFSDLDSDTSGSAFGANAKGGTFTPSVSGQLYSITIETSGAGCSDATLTLRWGASNDLDTYNEETAKVNPGAGTVEFAMSDGDSVSSSTPYYFGIIQSSGAGTCYFRYYTPGSGGTYYSSASVWDTMSLNSTLKPSLAIKICE